MDAVHRITQAFQPIQEVIEAAAGLGLEAQAEAATEALREILRAVGRQ